MEISRRKFIKGAAATGAVLAAGSYLVPEFLGDDIDSAAPVCPESAGECYTVVSDVDAHSQCRMRVIVKDGVVESIKGDPSDPESKGVLTMRGRAMKDILYAPDRLTRPLKRTGKRGEGLWAEISWDEALQTIAENLDKVKKQHGAEAISFLHGHYHSGDILGTYIPRLANLIGTPNVSNASHVCHLPRVFLEYNFDFGAVFPPDVKNTKCLVLWGGNPRATNKPQEIAIREARARGMKLIVIDPRETSYAREADIFAQVRPGTDGALALAMLNVIIEEKLYDQNFVKEWTTGFDKLVKHIRDYTPEKMEKICRVEAATIKDMARMYATAKPAAISPRNALDQHTNSSGAIRAINMLMALTGSLDVKGGNIMDIPILMGINDLKLYDKLPPEQEAKKIGADKCLYSKLSNTWPAAHTPSVWEAAATHDPYPIKAMMIFAANPVLTCANTNVVLKGMENLDFTAVADLFMSPTARLADIVLPASTFLETTRFVTYDTHADHGWNKNSRIALSPRVVDPVGDSRPDWKIICDLGKKMGYGEYFPWKNEEEAIDEVIKPLGLTCEDLKCRPDGVTIKIPPFLYKKLDGATGRIMRGALKMTKFRNYPEMYEKYEMKGFNTPTGKIALYSERLAEHGFDPLPVYREPAESPVSRPDLAADYPLIIIAGSKLEPYTHSMMRNIKNLRKQHPDNYLEIHPKTAAGLGVKDGDKVKVSSPRGSIMVKASLTESLAPDVVHLFHGFEESNCNFLTDHKAFDPLTGSTGLKSLLCRVEKTQG